MSQVLDIFARAQRKVSSLHLSRLELKAFDLRMQQDAAQKDMENELDAFWTSFDKIFQPEDTIQYFDGWDLITAKYLYHTKWHVHVAKTSGGFSHSGIPICVTTDFEKIA